MDALFSSISPAVLAVFGPGGLIGLTLAYILWSHMRGREERQARLTEESTRSLREDQRQLMERQDREIAGLRVDLETLTARLRATEALAGQQRIKLYDMYVLCRENTHAANNARQLLISKGIMQPTDFQPLVWPEVPITY